MLTRVGIDSTGRRSAINCETDLFWLRAQRSHKAMSIAALPNELA